MSDLNGNLSGSGTLSGRLGGGGAPAQDVYWDDILNKPNFAAVATSGSYNDLVNKPNLANVATSGSYNDLTDKPTIPAAQVNADWNATSGVAEILNKPTLAPVATSGSYNDLTNTPTIPAAQVNADWNAASGVAEILNKPTLAPVATSGSYNDLTNTPTIPPAQVNADWNAASGVAEILNKPTIPTTASQIDYDNTTSGLQADDVQDAITELKSNLTDKASRTWIYVGYGATVTIPEDYTEALIYIFGRNTSGGNRRIGAQLTFLPQLWGEQLSNKIEFLVAGYHISNTDHGYGSIAVTNNGKSFSIQGWTYGNGNAGDTYVMVYYRK